MKRSSVAATMVALVAVAASGVALAQKSPACKPVSDAMLKAIVTDHTLEVTADGGKVSHLVTSGGTMYIERNGKWVKSPMTSADMEAQEKENLADTKVYTCAPVAAVPGVSGTAYHVHSESEDAGVSDGTVVVSGGLPVFIDVTRKSDGQTSHSVQRYGYAGVHAPM
ncbi:MAG: hypothetical protein JSR18_06505 [Proteobacteria bacterium]|nr:hypothetical protein [Pseudomonadota bacterium]